MIVDPDRLVLARLAAAVLLTVAVLAGCFVLLVTQTSGSVQTAAMEFATIIITAWVAYYASLDRRQTP